MIKLLLTLATVLLISGCGYADKNECMLKEQQKCEGNCFNEAYFYCEAKFPPTKAQRELADKMTKGLNRPSYKTLKECTDKITGGRTSGYKKASEYCKSDKVIIYEEILGIKNN